MTTPTHVLVTTTNVWGDLEAQGLLLEWRIRDGAGWALVVWAETYSGGWQTYQRWLPADKIRAAPDVGGQP